MDDWAARPFNVFDAVIQHNVPVVHAWLGDGSLDSERLVIQVAQRFHRRRERGRNHGRCMWYNRFGSHRGNV